MVYAIYVLISFLNLSRGKNISNMAISYGGYSKKSEHSLMKTPFQQVKVSSVVECLKHCNEKESCQSIDMQSDNCKLFSENKYASRQQFMKSSHITHYSKMNTGCELKKCKNNATCFPHYTNNTFMCQCQTGFYGVYPDWWLKFDGNTENHGKSKSDITVNIKTSDEGSVAFGGQPNKFGRYMRCNRRCTENTVPPLQWIDPSVAKEGITIAMWIRFAPGEEKRQNGIVHGRSHIISHSYIGYTIAYETHKRQWLFQLHGKAFEYYILTIPMKTEETLKWNFVAYVWNQTELTISGMVNDEFKTISRAGDHARPSADPVEKTGQLFHPINNPCIFDIEDFRVWYQALSMMELTEIYNREKKDIWD